MDRPHLSTIGKLAYVALLLGMAAVGSISMAVESLHDVKLEGAEPTAPKPTLGFTSVRAEVFQKEATLWFEQRWGLRGYAVRTDNTIGVKVFHETRTDQHPVIGEGGVLFTRDDLAYVNRRESSDDTIALAEQFARVQKKLEPHGKVLLPIVLPSKTTFYREAVPPSWRRRGAFGHSDRDLYGAFVQALTASGALFVDARAILTAEAKGPEEVFLKTARHWRPWPSCRALQAAIDVVRPRLPEMGDEQLDCKTELDPAANISSTEYDIYRLLNTWEPAPRDVEVDHLIGEKRGAALRVPTLFVGSSFVWSFGSVSRKLQALSPSLVYYYDETVVDAATEVALRRVVPFTTEWREDTFSRRLFIVAVLETYLPYDGQKFLDEIEKEVDRREPTRR